MGFLPFDVSYILFTPRRVRLPGEPPKSPTSPSKSGGVQSNSLRLRGHAPVKSKSFRSLIGGKSSTPSNEEKVQQKLQEKFEEHAT